MPIEVIRRSGGISEIKCAFCHGERIDPFGVLSDMSLCPVCGGKSTVKVVEPLRECAFCVGTGVHPGTKLTCTVCKGKGTVTIGEPASECPECQGTGTAYPLNLPCTRCGGRGLVWVKEKESSNNL
ncbi:MAG: zinc finger domain-containing protein [Candidatus Binatia bacterium]